MNLPKLKRKKAKRVKSRKAHFAYYEEHKAKGRKNRAAWQLRAMNRDEKAIKKLNRLIEKAEKATPPSGTGAWGGSESIIVNEVSPLVKKRTGADRNSGKRVETYGNPGSDHHVSQTTASAGDYPLVNDQATAAATYAMLTGNPASQWGGDYSNFYIERANKNFRVQLIAGTHGTGPHFHCGIRLA